MFEEEPPQTLQQAHRAITRLSILCAILMCGLLAAVILFSAAVNACNSTHSLSPVATTQQPGYRLQNQLDFKTTVAVASLSPRKSASSNRHPARKRSHGQGAPGVAAAKTLGGGHPTPHQRSPTYVSHV